MKYVKPRRLPEANIQAELYRVFRNLDIEVCLEYRIYLPEEGRNIIADIAVVNGDDIALLIEVKSKNKGSKPHFAGKQYQRYLNLGIPFMYCLHMDEVESIISRALEYLV